MSVLLPSLFPPFDAEFHAVEQHQILHSRWKVLELQIYFCVSCFCITFCFRSVLVPSMLISSTFSGPQWTSILRTSTVVEYYDCLRYTSLVCPFASGNIGGQYFQTWFEIEVMGHNPYYCVLSFEGTSGTFWFQFFFNIRKEPPFGFLDWFFKLKKPLFICAK